MMKYQRNGNEKSKHALFGMSGVKAQYSKSRKMIITGDYTTPKNICAPFLLKQQQRKHDFRLLEKGRKGRKWISSR